MDFFLGRIELTLGQEEDAQKWLEKLLRINTRIHGLTTRSEEIGLLSESRTPRGSRRGRRRNYL